MVHHKKRKKETPLDTEHDHAGEKTPVERARLLSSQLSTSNGGPLTCVTPPLFQSEELEIPDRAAKCDLIIRASLATGVLGSSAFSFCTSSGQIHPLKSLGHQFSMIPQSFLYTEWGSASSLLALCLMLPPLLHHTLIMKVVNWQGEERQFINSLNPAFLSQLSYNMPVPWVGRKSSLTSPVLSCGLHHTFNLH